VAEFWEKSVICVDFIYRAGWNGLMNSAVAALVVYLIRAIYVLGKKRAVPHLWVAVFAASLCPFSLIGMLGMPENGNIVNMVLGSSLKFYFFILWEGLSAILVISSFYRCRKRKWKALESMQLEDNVYLLECIKKPVVCGFFHPMIYIPAELPEELREKIVAHKKRLIAGGSHKLIVGAVLVTYFNWFNPILWLSLYYFSEDLKRL